MIYHFVHRNSLYLQDLFGTDVTLNLVSAPLIPKELKPKGCSGTRKMFIKASSRMILQSFCHEALGYNITKIGLFYVDIMERT